MMPANVSPNRFIVGLAGLQSALQAHGQGQAKRYESVTENVERGRSRREAVIRLGIQGGNGRLGERL